MRIFVTLQSFRYRVRSIDYVSERATEEEHAPVENRFGFYIGAANMECTWVGYPREDQAIAILDDLHKLLDGDDGD